MFYGHDQDWGEAHPAAISEFGRVYADALLASDERAAENAVREAMDARLSPAEIDDEIIAPALWRIGELWQKGEISIAEEHIATAISTRVMALHRAVDRVAGARATYRVMLATPVGELHVVALQMVGELLRAAGFDVIMLGADVPAAALVSSVERHRPAVVCLSATLPGRMPQLLEALDCVARDRPGTGFVLGGRGLTSRPLIRPDVRVCGRVCGVVEAVDAMAMHANFN